MTTSLSHEPAGQPPTAVTEAGPGVTGTDRLRRPAVALALFLAPLGLLMANAGYAWATRHGGSDQTGADLLALAWRHPRALRLSLTAALIGSLLLIPAVLGMMRLTARRTPWLSLAGGSLMIAGYACYLAVLAHDAPALAMARIDDPQAMFGHVLDVSRDDGWMLWTFVVFVVGNLGGTFLLGLALLRSHTVAAWAAIAVLAWPVLHIAGLAAGSEWFEVAGAVLQAAGFAAAGIAVLRRKGGWSPVQPRPDHHG